MDEKKTCCICKNEKPISDFNKIDNRCRDCLKKYRQSEAYKSANRERAKRDYADPVKREQMKARSRAYYLGLKEAAAESNPDPLAKAKAVEQLGRLTAASRVSRKRWREANLERARELNREAAQKWRSNPRNKLSSQMSSLIRQSLLAKIKAGRHWENLLPYTIDQLRSHLESLWEPGMSWDNHTTDGWHIDHVRPVSSFEFHSPEDQEFKDCWSLFNLVPRWSTTEAAMKHGSNQIGNLNKSDREIKE